MSLNYIIYLFNLKNCFFFYLQYYVIIVIIFFVALLCIQLTNVIIMKLDQFLFTLNTCMKYTEFTLFIVCLFCFVLY